MPAELWQTECENCRAVVAATADSIRRDDPDGATRFKLTCKRCGKTAVYVVPDPSAAPEAVRPFPRMPMAVPVGVLCAALGLAAGFAAGFGVGRIGPPAPAATAVKKYTRSEFDRLVDQKSPEEVLAAVGKPDRTTDTGNWTYYGVTYDPAAKQMDTAAEVRFNNNINPKCTEVRFR